MAAFRLGQSELIARRKRLTTALGFMLIGLGAGAIAGLLTAPKSGKLLRKDVRNKLDDARDAAERLGKRAGDLWDKGEELAEVARHKGEELAEAARHKVEPVARILRRA
jgi:gas vesicle protein